MGGVAQQTRMQRTDAFKITLNTANQEQLLKQKHMQGIFKKLNQTKNIATTVQYSVGDYELWWCFN